MKKKNLRKFAHPVAKPASEVTLPPFPWDMGANGKANREGLILEDAVDTQADGDTLNPNKVKRARRMDMLEVWHKRWKQDRRGANGNPLPHITTRQYNAAERYKDAFLRTQQSPGWNDNDRVQASANPGLAVEIQIGRLSDFVAISRHVRPQDRSILDWVVLQGRMPKGTGRTYQASMDHLRAALDRLADAMGA